MLLHLNEARQHTVEETVLREFRPRRRYRAYYRHAGGKTNALEYAGSSCQALVKTSKHSKNFTTNLKASTNDERSES